MCKPLLHSAIVSGVLFSVILKCIRCYVHHAQPNLHYTVIDYVNNSSAGKRFVLAISTATPILTGTAAHTLNPGANLTIVGIGASRSTIQFNNGTTSNRFFTVGDGATLTLGNNITLYVFIVFFVQRNKCGLADSRQCFQPCCVVSAGAASNEKPCAAASGLCRKGHVRRRCQDFFGAFFAAAGFARFFFAMLLPKINSKASVAFSTK